MDKERLYYEMRRRHISVDQMCGKIGMSTVSFYRKSNGISEFTQSEIQKVVSALDEVEKVTDPISIFFADGLS